MPSPGQPLRKLGFLTIGLFDGGRPGPRPRVDAGDHRARRAARLRQRLGPAPAPAVRHLLAGRRAGRRVPAHQPHRAGHRGHPAGLGEPAAAGRGPGHGRPAVRRPAQPGGQRRPADALRPTSRRRSTPTPPTSRTSATSGSSGCCGFVRGEPATDFSGVEGIEVFSDRVQPHSPGLGRPHVVRRRQPALGPVGRRARDELPDQQRRQGRGVGGLRRDPALAHRDLPRPPPATERPPGSPRDWWSSRPTPPRRSSGRSTRRTRSRGTPRTATPQGPARMMFARRPGRHVSRDRRAAVRPRRVPRDRRGGVRAAVQLRARRLRADPHRHRHPPRPGAGLDAVGGLTGWAGRGRRQDRLATEDSLRNGVHAKPVEAVATLSGELSGPTRG